MIRDPHIPLYFDLEGLGKFEGVVTLHPTAYTRFDFLKAYLTSIKEWVIKNKHLVVEIVGFSAVVIVLLVLLSGKS